MRGCDPGRSAVSSRVRGKRPRRLVLQDVPAHDREPMLRRGRRESEILKAILQYLGARGILAFRANTGAFVGEYKGKRRFVRFSERGMPDIHGVLPGGRALYIEVKGPTGRLSPWQVAQIDRLRRQGALAFVARSVPDVAAMLPFANPSGQIPAGGANLQDREARPLSYAVDFYRVPWPQRGPPLST